VVNAINVYTKQLENAKKGEAHPEEYKALKDAEDALKEHLETVGLDITDPDQSKIKKL